MLPGLAGYVPSGKPFKESSLFSDTSGFVANWAPPDTNCCVGSRSLWPICSLNNCVYFLYDSVIASSGLSCAITLSNALK